MNLKCFELIVVCMALRFASGKTIVYSFLTHIRSCKRVPSTCFHVKNYEEVFLTH